MKPKRGHERSEWKELAANGSFQRYWFGATMGALGFAMLGLPLELYALDSTGSAQSAAAIVSCIAVSQLVCAPLAGWLADLFPRKQVLLASEIGRACVCFVVVVIVAGSGPLWSLYLCCVVFGIVQSAGAPARAVMLRDLVSERTLFNALRQDEVRLNIARIGAPPLGGALYALGEGWVFVACLVGFITSALAISSIRVAEPRRLPGCEAAGDSESIWGMVRNASGVLLGVACIAASSASAGTLVVVTLRAAGGGSAQVGSVLACEAVGGIVGALVLRKAIVSRLGVCVGVSLTAVLVCCVLFGVVQSWWAAAVLLIVSGLASAITGIALDSALFSKVGGAVRGRAISSTFVLIGLGGVSGRLAMGTSLDHFATPVAVALVAGGIGTIGVLSLLLGVLVRSEVA